MIVVADTSPVNYLVLIGCADVLAALFGEVIVPPAVVNELEHLATPLVVRQWIASRPSWVRMQTPKQVDKSLDLETGEVEAIALAQELRADALLVDEQKARRVAVARGIPIAGTLGVIKLGASKGLLNAREVLAALRRTSFFIDESVIARVFGELYDAEGGGGRGD